jgi:hypothetical protein
MKEFYEDHLRLTKIHEIHRIRKQGKMVAVMIIVYDASDVNSDRIFDNGYQ